MGRIVCPKSGDATKKTNTSLSQRLFSDAHLFVFFTCPCFPLFFTTKLGQQRASTTTISFDTFLEKNFYSEHPPTFCFASNYSKVPHPFSLRMFFLNKPIVNFWSCAKENIKIAQRNVRMSIFDVHPKLICQVGKQPNTCPTRSCYFYFVFLLVHHQLHFTVALLLHSLLSS